MNPPQLQSTRLLIRPIEASDAPFICELLNTPGFLTHIGDRGVRNESDARTYIQNGPNASYARYGHGLMAVERLEDGKKLGICGLLKRETLDHADIGFAFLPEFMGKGYAAESARRVLQWGRDEAAMHQVLAIVSPANSASIQLLNKLGFQYLRREVVVPGNPEVDVFLCELDQFDSQGHGLSRLPV